MDARTRAHLTGAGPSDVCHRGTADVAFRPRLDRYSKIPNPKVQPQIPSVARDWLQIGVWVLELVGIWDLGMNGAERFQLHGALPRRRAAGANNSDHDREV